MVIAHICLLIVRHTSINIFEVNKEVKVEINKSSSRQRQDSKNAFKHFVRKIFLTRKSLKHIIFKKTYSLFYIWN